MCEYAAIGRNWGLVNKFGNIFLDFDRKQHYLLELREKEWAVNFNPACVDGMKAYYETENKKMLLKRLKEIGVKDPETRVEIVLEVRRIVERRFAK